MQPLIYMEKSLKIKNMTRVGLNSSLRRRGQHRRNSLRRRGDNEYDIAHTHQGARGIVLVHFVHFILKKGWLLIWVIYTYYGFKILIGEISKIGFNVAGAIFQNGCPVQYPRILINTEQSNNCDMRVYGLGDSDFKYTITWLLRHLFPPFLKMAVVNTNVPISQMLRHLEELYWRRWLA